MKIKSEDENKKKSLDLSVKEGSASAFMSGAGESYIIPYALSLNANNIQIGFLSSFVSLFGAFSQIIGSKFLYYFDRKKIVLFSVFIQATMWIAIIGLGLLVWKGIINGYAATLLVVFYTFYAIVGNIGGPSWFSWMGDLVPEKNRGKYFSKRNKIVGFIALSVTLISAFVLDYYKNKGILFIGFVILFVIAAIGRYISGILLTRHYNPDYEINKESYFGFLQFVKKSPKNNFGKFVIFVSLINLTTYFAAPFFTVYMLKDLGYSYTTFIIVTMSASLFTILSISYLGKFGDKYGNKMLLSVGSIIIPFSSFLWLFSTNPIYLILTAQLLAGVGWAAFNLASSNFIYDAVTPQRRAICVSYFSMMNGIGIFIGASLGGLFAQYVHLSFINVFLLIFLISSFLKGLVVFIFLPKIKEVKEVSSFKYKEALNFVAVGTPRPFYGIFRGVFSIITLFNGRKNKPVTN